MSEVLINFYNEGVSTENEILIKVSVDNESNLEYKFIEGINGVWSPIQDFTDKDHCVWKPQKEGRYIIMVQARKLDTTKPFDYLGKSEYEFKENINPKEIAEWDEEQKLIANVNLQKTKYTLGEKVDIKVDTLQEETMVRVWKRGNLGWEPVRGYSTESNIKYTTNTIGDHELLIEARRPQSQNKVDDFQTIKFKVEDRSKIEITDFQCMTDDLLVNEELIFKIETNHDNNRNLLYKYLRINEKDGKVRCIQDYSSKQIVSFREKEDGKYKLLCFVRDLFSNKEYDDRAIIVYDVKPYSEVKIKLLNTDMPSPQLIGNKIKLNASVTGGRELLYRYLIDGPEKEDTGYRNTDLFEWESKVPGEYKITLYVKDSSCESEFEDQRTIEFEIDSKGLKPVRILDIQCSETKNCIVGQPVNLKVIAEGGGAIKYSFIVYKDDVEVERIDYGDTNWTNFTPTEKGSYEIELRVKDRRSTNKYDNHSYVYLKVKEYKPVTIDYVLLASRECYLVGDTIEMDVITENTSNTLLRYVTLINGKEVEDTGFISSTKLKVNPKCAGKYKFLVYGKNVKCSEEYDCKSEVSVYVHEAVPVTNTTISVDKEKFKVNDEITFEVNSEGGKEVCYEFYIMEKGNWVKSQEYSRKNYYTFLPFTAGKYRLLVLSKSYYKKVNYEDYDIYEFLVEY